MEERRRKLVARGLLAVLAASALLSLVGAGLLVAERRGLVTLRRTPRVSILYEFWTDEGIGWAHEIAVVNTDTNPGFLRIALVDVENGAERVTENVWFPARSIMLRYVPGRIGRMDETTAIFRGKECIFRVDERNVERLDDGRVGFVARGARVALDLGDIPGGVLWLETIPGVKLVRRPGVEVVADWEKHHPITGGKHVTRSEFKWTNSVPIELDIERDFSEPTIICYGGVVGAHTAAGTWILHDPDMKVIDQRR